MSSLWWLALPVLLLQVVVDRGRGLLRGRRPFQLPVLA